MSLFVIGAILAFAVNIELQYVSLDLIGYILMGAGLVVFSSDLCSCSASGRAWQPLERPSIRPLVTA